MSDDPYARLTRLIERHGAELNQFLIEIQQTSSETEFARLRTVIAQIMGNGHHEAFLRIFSERPDLKPKWWDA